MSYNKFLLLGVGVLLSTFVSSPAYAVNCSISYYCYRSMTPGPAPAGNDVLVRRTTAASNRVAAAARRAQAQRPRTNAGAGQRRAAPLTLQQRQAEARRREQQQQRELAQRRQRAAQQAQQRQTEQRQRAQQLAQRQLANLTPQQRRLVEAQRRAHQAEQQRLAQQRRNQQANRAQPVANRTPDRPAAPAPASAVQSCAVIDKKIAELNRQAVLRSKEKQYDQAQRLFKAVDQLKTEGRRKQCPGII